MWLEANSSLKINLEKSGLILMGNVLGGTDGQDGL